MKEFLLDNLVTIIGFLGVPLAYIFGGKRAKELELKSKETTIKKDDSDALKSMQEVYNSFLEDYKLRMVEVMSEITAIKKHNKDLQLQFNEINLLYHKEIEKSKNWEKKHNELQTAHDKLKKDFDKLKLSIK